MTLPASGTITLGDVEAEFSVGRPISMSEIYKGGDYVLETDNAPNVPASGPISLSQFYGAAYVPPIPLSASAAPGSVSGSDDQGPTITTTAPAVCTPSSGQGPYSYLWGIVSGDAAVQPVTPAAATTYFLANLSIHTSASAVYRCMVTDSLGAVAYSNTVTVTLEWP